MSLKAHNISAGYGDMVILNEVSLEAPHDAITGIIGPNGAGKSTLLKAIFGYLKPTSGIVTYNDINITGNTPRNILNMGVAYVPQARALFPSMTVMENLLLAGYSIKNRKKLNEAVDEVLESYTLLKDRIKQKAGTMSGGEQRILEIARALVIRPKIIMLDEPSAALSPKFAHEVYEKIVEIHEKGTGMLIVEQNVQLMLEFADYIYALELGRNADSGSPAVFLESDRLSTLYLGSTKARGEG